MYILKVVLLIVIYSAITVEMVMTCRRAYKHKISAQKAKKRLTVCGLLVCGFLAVPFVYASYIIPKPDEPVEDDDLAESDSFIAPFGDPIASITNEPFEFRLSEVQGSDAVAFGKEYFDGKNTTFQNLMDSENAAVAYLESLRNIGDCVPLYSTVKLVSVDEDKVPFKEKAKTLEECDARASAAYTKATEAVDQLDKQNWYSKMAQAGLDGLYLSRNDADMERRWQYAEIAFCGLVNSYILQEYNSTENSDLLYNFGQVFNHLGKISKAEKDVLLEYRMYFTATQFYHQAYNLLKLHSFEVEGVVYDDEVCDAYGTLLYRMGLYVTEKQKFYEEAKECGDVAVSYNLCDESDLNSWLQPVKDELEK